MTEPHQRNRLAAILAADAVGYSRLMAADDRATVATLDAARAVFRRHIESSHGRVIDMAGDSVLAAFDTAAGAASAALAIQQDLEAASRYVAEDHRLSFRMGLHLGDVIEKADGTIYGNGVNIAARLQALAEPGGIRMSQIVHETVKGKVAMQATFVGTEQVKNIPDAIPVWKVEPAGLPAAPMQAPTAAAPPPSSTAKLRSRRGIAAALATLVVIAIAGGWHASRPASVPTEPVAGTKAAAVDTNSIAILPFADLSEARNMAYFADGMHEDLLTQLALVGGLKVVSRTSVMDYRNTKKNVRQIGSELGVGTLVEGSVRRFGDRVRVTAQVIDTRADKHLWANSYDRELKDIFAIQSELATEIAQATKVSLTTRDRSQLERRPTANLGAYELFLRHRQLTAKGDAAGSFVYDLKRGIDLLQRAVALDPNFALAWALLGVDEARVRFYLGDMSEERLARARRAVDRAISLSPDDLEVRMQLGYLYYYGYRDYALATQHTEDLLRLAPNNVEMLLQLSFLRRREGRWADSIDLLNKILSIDPRNVSALRNLAENLRRFRRFDESLAVQQRLAELAPGNVDVAAQLHWVRSAASGSFAEWDAWRKTLTTAQAESSAGIWYADINRAVGGRDLEAALRLTQTPQAKVFERDFGEEGLSSLRATLLLALGRRGEAKEIARSGLPGAMQALRRNPLYEQSQITALLFLAILGEKDVALAELRKLRANDKIRSDVFSAGMVLQLEAPVLALLGDRAGALKALARAAKEPNGDNTLGGSRFSRGEPAFASLWDSSEFLAIIDSPASNAPLPVENRGIPKLPD